MNILIPTGLCWIQITGSEVRVNFLGRFCETYSVIQVYA
jgi:hypothetical protein